MKTIVHINLGDADRNLIATYLERKKTTRMASRKEVNDLVQQHITDIICQADAGEYDDDSRIEQRTIHDEVPSKQGQPRESGDDSSPQAFAPSRGDEDYLAQPKDTDIAAACSRILDDASLINAFAWDTVERNRKT